jgi:hypothetical protein
MREVTDEFGELLHKFDIETLKKMVVNAQEVHTRLIIPSPSDFHLLLASDGGRSVSKSACVLRGILWFSFVINIV